MCRTAILLICMLLEVMGASAKSIHRIPQQQPVTDSVARAIELWDLGYAEYEKQNYQAAYEFFKSSYSFCNSKFWLDGKRRPYDAMNHCLYKMGKDSLIDKKDSPYYYEDPDTIEFFDSYMKAAMGIKQIDSLWVNYNHSLKIDTINGRLKRFIHEKKLNFIAGDCFSKGYYQEAIKSFRDVLDFNKRILPEDKKYISDYTYQRIVESFLQMNQSDSAIAVAKQYVQLYDAHDEKQYLSFKDATGTLFYAYLRSARYNEAYQVLEDAAPLLQNMPFAKFKDMTPVIWRADYYKAIGRYDMAYSLRKMVNQKQDSDTLQFFVQDKRDYAIANSWIGNHEEAIKILEDLIGQEREWASKHYSTEHVTPYININDLIMLGDAYFFNRQPIKALDKYMEADSLQVLPLSLQSPDSVGQRHQIYPKYAETLFKISRTAYQLGRFSLGDIYYNKLKHDIDAAPDILGKWSVGLKTLDVVKLGKSGDIMAAIPKLEQLIADKNGRVHNDMLEYLAHMYIATPQHEAGKAYDIASKIVANKKKYILDNLEQLTEQEKAMLWTENKWTFRLLLWSIVLQGDSLTEQLYDDIALFAKGLMLTVSSASDYKQALSVTWHDVQQHLGDHEAAIEFITVPELTNEPDSTLYMALIVKKEMIKPEIVYLCTASELKESISDGYIDNEDLYDMIWGSMEEELSDVNTVYFSADGYLHRIPIEYMLTKQRPLKLDAYRLTSTRELVLRQKNSQPHGKAVLYGGLTYNNTYENNDDNRKPRGYERNEKYNNLGYSQNEVDSICLLLKPKHPCEIYDKQNGTASSLIALNGQKLFLLHMATHGYYYSQEQVINAPLLDNIITSDNQNGLMNIEEDSPMLRSGLVMADRKISAEEISKIHFEDLQLIVLSSCKSGLGDISDREGVWGLQRAFKQAGAKSILMTLWDVKDYETYKFMKIFYKRVCKGDSYTEALRKAQKNIKKLFPNEKNWAGFILLDAFP